MPAVAPNILWVITTQWRGRALRCAGDPNARTPCLDRWAGRGIRYTQAVTPHPFGPFARAALLTGVPSPENGVREYYDPLPDGARTVAHELTEHGYRTAWFGKWHLARRDPAAPLVGEAHARMIVPPAGRGGFAFWEGFEGGFLLNDPFLHGTEFPEPVQIRGYQSDVVCGRAVEWVARDASVHNPWFCVVSLEPPHPPYDAPCPGEGSDPATLRLDPNVPVGGTVEDRARRELAGYYRHIAATDRAIGELLGRVQAVRGNAARDTRVVVTSVHGDMHGAHGCFRKGWPHDESVCVPLLILSLGQQLHARVDSRPVSLLDLPALAAAWARGREWEPRAEPVAISMPSIVRLPHQCDRVWHGRRSERGKAVVDTETGEPWLVFDLGEDPWEMRNLAGDPRGRKLARALGLRA